MKVLSEKYFDFLASVKKASNNTLLSYRRDINNYIEFLKIKKQRIETANGTTVLDYLMGLQQSGKSASTVSRSLASIRSMYRFLQNEGTFTVDPTAQFHSLKAE